MSRLFDDLMEGAKALEDHLQGKSHYAPRRLKNQSL